MISGFGPAVPLDVYSFPLYNRTLNSTLKLNNMQSLKKRVTHQNVFELFYSRVLVNWNFYPRMWVQSSKRKRLYRFFNLLRESKVGLLSFISSYLLEQSLLKCCRAIWVI